MQPRHAIVMLSIGEHRTWRDHSFGSFARVANHWNVDAHLITRDDAAEVTTSDLHRRPGRQHKRAYALKSYYAWKFLTESKYDKVLIVDDTCVIHPAADNIFQHYASSKLAVKKTSRAHARASFEHIRRLVREGYAESVKFDALLYGNTGVVLYDSEAADAFSPQKINDAKRMLYARYPHQTLFYYLHRKAKISVDLMDERWNLTPGRDLSATSRKALMSARDYIDSENHTVMHFTGAYANRATLVEDLAQRYATIPPRDSSEL